MLGEMFGPERGVAGEQFGALQKLPTFVTTNAGSRRRLQCAGHATRSGRQIALGKKSLERQKIRWEGNIKAM
jgi:hypothetical protein